MKNTKSITIGFLIVNCISGYASQENLINQSQISLSHHIEKKLDYLTLLNHNSTYTQHDTSKTYQNLTLYSPLTPQEHQLRLNNKNLSQYIPEPLYKNKHFVKSNKKYDQRICTIPQDNINKNELHRHELRRKAITAILKTIHQANSRSTLLGLTLFTGIMCVWTQPEL
jgi:hypothetical protein